MKISEDKKADLLVELGAGLEQLNINATDEQKNLLIDYLCLLQQWSQAYNLTAIKNVGDMLYLHILDSVVIAPYCEGVNFIDVGTGAGLPGIPLAILFPDKHFTLLDSNGKKTRFLFHVKTSLGLHNITVVQSRVETYQADHLFDGVLSRAFASIGDMLAGSEHLLAENGHFYAMKGLSPTNELADVSESIRVEHNYSLQVPGVDAERHLTVLQKIKN